MKLIFSENAWSDYLYWQRTDKKILKRINLLIRDIQRMPYEGIGKPEPLKHGLSGYWSRRITDEHRIVYTAEEDAILIAQLRYHYQIFLYNYNEAAPKPKTAIFLQSYILLACCFKGIMESNLSSRDITFK